MPMPSMRLTCWGTSPRATAHDSAAARARTEATRVRHMQGSSGIGSFAGRAGAPADGAAGNYPRELRVLPVSAPGFAPAAGAAAEILQPENIHLDPPPVCPVPPPVRERPWNP